ncbi:hypothetical protein ONZ43_g4107 [Nemania bipapillata]|uniref:Uncharacterized protein n=1 Tax=Nemania bipapillata TaxID=110536 RepID=A0ACC2IRL8_9PEZI|nr:hypothetical protein ONZ43_g4107 [Nemania bipapillata]
MARLSLALLVVALLQTGLSQPIVKEGQDLPTSLLTAVLTVPTAITGTGSSPLPTDIVPHIPHLHQPHPASKPTVPEKRNLPVTPEWLRWLPFESINM